MNKAVFNWSSGKDSALALYKILRSQDLNVAYLVTNLNKNFKRVSMHGLSEALLDAQAEALGLPLYKIWFHGDVSMEDYTRIMQEELNKLIETGVSHSIYGDIFLENLKAFRQELHKGLPVDLVYPLWNRSTRELLLEFIDLGFKAIPICINANLMDASFLGRTIDHQFLEELPESVDPCGENGEFHTFVYDGPIFKHPVAFEHGETVLRTYGSESKGDEKSWDSKFWYLDLVPK